MSHTPGPWRVKEGLDRDTGEIATYVYGGLAIIAECYGPDSVDNARLIVAAGDLLEVLKSVKARLERNGISGRMLPELPMIDAAIAKATGGEV